MPCWKSHLLSTIAVERLLTFSTDGKLSRCMYYQYGDRPQKKMLSKVNAIIVLRDPSVVDLTRDVLRDDAPSLARRFRRVVMFRFLIN